MGKQQVRARKEPSPGKKVSDVEAAYVVQSYLVEKHFTKTLAGFRIDAAPVLNSLKNAPSAVRSLTTILNDFVILREKQLSLQEENARLEQCLKEAQQVLQRERSRMNSFVQGVHESLAVFQQGCASPNALALPSMSSSPTNSAAVFQVGQNTPPAAGVDLAKTPCSVRGMNSTSNKRKNVLNIALEAPGSGTPTMKTTAVKKARPSGQVSDPLPAGSPWMCGAVRKNSANMMRPVLPMPHQGMHESPSRSKSAQPGRSLPSSRTSTQLASPSAAPSNTDPIISSHSAVPTTSSEPSREAPFDKDQAFGQDPHTPPRSSSPANPPEQMPLHFLPPDGSVHLQPSSVSAPETRSSTPLSAPEELSCQQPGEDRTANGSALNSDSSNESTPESCRNDSVGEQFVGEQFHHKKVHSRTMRPLDFSGSALMTRDGSPSSEMSPPTMSPAPSELGGASAGAQVEDASEHSTSDLFLIDDFLAIMDDASLSSLVGDMMGTVEITMNDLPSNSQTYGDVDFSNIHNVADRCSVGEDSFGFQCLTDAANCENDPALAVDRLLEPDGYAISDALLTTVSFCSRPEIPVSILSERDPNRNVSESSPRRCSSPYKHSSKRETKAKHASGQENVPAPNFVDMVGGANSLSTCS